MNKVTAIVSNRKSATKKAITHAPVQAARKRSVAKSRKVITQRVLPFGNGWVVKPDHMNKFVTVTTTQRQAIDIAMKLAKNDRANLVIYNKDGSIKSHKSFVAAAGARTS